MTRLSLALTACLCVGLGAPALAASTAQTSASTSAGTATSTHHHKKKTHAAKTSGTEKAAAVTKTAHGTSKTKAVASTTVHKDKHTTVVASAAVHLRHKHHAALALAAAAPAAVAVAASTPPAAPAPVPAVDPNKGTDSGLPLPRFAALRSDQVSLRAGPGTRYPIEWVYQRRYLPVEIEREFEVWRLVSEPDGTKGWVHQAMLTGRRGFLINADQPQTMRASASDTAAAVAILKPGVVGKLVSCPGGSDWCQVDVQSYRGWLPRSAFWGTLPDETVIQQ